MKMTANRRIALNIAATYLRSFYKLALGLLTARWLLLALGHTDYGLLGVVGGLVAFVTFINRLLSGAVSRYYSFAIGAARKDRGQKGLMECRRWFSAAVSVHSVIPGVLILIGWPVGEYAVRHWLVIPPDRLVASLWVWRFTCVSALTAMMNVPFRAMYVAKQEILELTLYSMTTTTVTAFLLYYMVTHPADWLARYAFWHCLIALVPRLAMMLRAVCMYPECRLRRDCLWRWKDIRELALYACWNAFGELGRVVKSQGLAIVVNRCFGVVSNAAITVANRLSARANTFSASIVGAFHPAIVTAYGAGEKARMKRLVFKSDKLASAMVAVVSVPLALEVHEVMRMWLKSPPADSPALCACVLLLTFMNEATMGQAIAVAATGKVALNRFLNGLAFMLAVPVACLFVSLGCGLISVVYAQFFSSLASVVIRLAFAQRLAGVSSYKWVASVLLPLVVCSSLAAMAGLPTRLLMPPSSLRVCLTVLSCEALMLPLMWFIVFDAEEREFVKAKWEKFRRKMGSSKGNGKGKAASDGHK